MNKSRYFSLGLVAVLAVLFMRAFQPQRTPTLTPLYVPQPTASVEAACGITSTYYQIDYWASPNERTYTARFMAAQGGTVRFCVTGACTQVVIDESYQLRPYTLTVHTPDVPKERPVSMWLEVTGPRCDSGSPAMRLLGLNYHVGN